MAEFHPIWAVHAAMLEAGILTSDAKFYYVDSKRLGANLGITWYDLRQHKSSRQLEAFLKKVS